MARDDHPQRQAVQFLACQRLAAGRFHRRLVVEQVVAAPEFEHAQGGVVGAGAVQAQVQVGVLDEVGDRFPVAVAADQDQPASGQVLGNPRCRLVRRVVQVQADVAEHAPRLEGVGGQLRLGRAGPQRHAAILQPQVQARAGQGAERRTIAGPLQQQADQAGAGTGGVAIPGGIDVGGNS